MLRRAVLLATILLVPGVAVALPSILCGPASLGCERWTHSEEAFSLPRALALSPDETTLFVGESAQVGEVVALDAATGNELWRARLPKVDGILALLATDDALFVAGHKTHQELTPEGFSYEAHDTWIARLESASGDVGWWRKIAGRLPWTPVTLDLGGGRLLVAGSSGYEPALVALDPADADRAWTFLPPAGGWGLSSVAVGMDRAYVLHDGTLHAVDLADGTPLASVQVPGARDAALGDTGLVVAGGGRAIGLDAATLATRWEAPVEGERLAIAGAKAYLAPAWRAGNLTALDVVTGQRAWAHPTGGEPRALAAAGGRVVVTAGDALADTVPALRTSILAEDGALLDTFLLGTGNPAGGRACSPEAEECYWSAHAAIGSGRTYVAAESNAVGGPGSAALVASYDA